MMNTRLPLDVGWMTYLFVIFVSCWGGLVQYLYKIQNKKGGRFSVLALVSDLAISGFSGVIVFWICVWKDVDMILTSVAIGIAGHLGSRTLFLLERTLEARYGKYFVDVEDRSNAKTPKEVIDMIEDVIDETVEEVIERKYDITDVSEDDIDEVLEKVRKRYRGLK